MHTINNIKSIGIYFQLFEAKNICQLYVRLDWERSACKFPIFFIDQTLWTIKKNIQEIFKILNSILDTIFIYLFLFLFVIQHSKQLSCQPKKRIRKIANILLIIQAIIIYYNKWQKYAWILCLWPVRSSLNPIWFDNSNVNVKSKIGGYLFGPKWKRRRSKKEKNAIFIVIVQLL